MNFMIPELVSGVQFSKGPYYADQGDFVTAGASNINYATPLERPIVTLEGGREGYARALFAGSRSLGSGNLLAAFEGSHDDGPWVHPDDFQKIQRRPELQPQQPGERVEPSRWHIMDAGTPPIKFRDEP